MNFFPKINPLELPDKRNHQMADWQYEKIAEQIKEFQDELDDEHEVGLMLASFGQPSLMIVTDIGYQNPNLMYFYGFINGKDAQLIQHISQLNFILTSALKEPKRPAFRIGFPTSDESE